MIFTKQQVNNSRVAAMQLKERDLQRNAANASELAHNHALRAAGFEVNAGRVPQEVWKDVDRVTVERMRSDDGDAFLNDLMPFTKSVSIGKLIYETTRASDAGTVQTSMSGQTGIKFDQVDYNYDGFLIPIHDAGYFRNFRELAAQTSEGFDSLIDDQRETVASVRKHLAQTFMTGHKDKNGQILTVKGRSWSGMSADSRVAQVDLGGSGVNFDFTDATKTGKQIKAALIEVLNTLWITNNCAKDVTVYISRQIARVWEQNFFDNTAGSSTKTIQEMAMLQGVQQIKVTNMLTGNQLMGFPLDGESVRPISGMSVSTFALPRPLYNSNHEYVVSTATGWGVKNDYFGNTCAFFAEA